ncbi:MAG TPA: cupin domain-containing protein [Patescibacteria group bacterium]|nr:cupin domain-containing protein [Patescibacteria group bacterium]
MEVKNIKDSIVFNDSTFTKRTLFAVEDILCFVLNMKPGNVLPLHTHENSSLVIHVLSGSGEAKINDEVAKLESGVVLYAKGEDEFSIPTVSEDMSIFVTLSPNPSNELYSKSLG